MTLWQRFIERAEQEDDYMSQILKWYGDIGMELLPNDKTGYTIVPVYQDEGGGWQNKEEWEYERQWLLPYGKQVANILRSLRKEDIKSEREFIVDF